MPRLVAIVLLLAALVPLAGCVVEDPVGYGYPHHGGRWCYYHPGRC